MILLVTSARLLAASVTWWQDHHPGTTEDVLAEAVSLVVHDGETPLGWPPLQVTITARPAGGRTTGH